MTTDFRDLGYGLTSEREFLTNKLVHDYDPRLSFRRIPEGDPYYTAENPWGVWEEGVAPGLSPWAFTVNYCDDRVIARLIEADLLREGASERIARIEAMNRASEASKMRQQLDEMEARREEMEGVARLATSRTTIRHRINGEDVIIGDKIRPVRSTI